MTGETYRNTETERAGRQGDVRRWRDRRKAQNEREAQASSGRGRGATERGKQEIEEEQSLAW